MGSNPISSENLQMFFYIKIFSKEKETLNKFLKFLSQLQLAEIQLKQLQKKNLRKFVTVLKSPHVNKTAQEQFDFRIFTKQIVLFSSKPFLFLMMFKKIKNLTFPGLKIEIRCLFKNPQKKNIILSTINPDNVVLKRKTRSSLTKYFQLFDSYGEFCLQTKFY